MSNSVGQWELATLARKSYVQALLMMVSFRGMLKLVFSCLVMDFCLLSAEKLEATTIMI